jgi:hypothetical protein
MIKASVLELVVVVRVLVVVVRVELSENLDVAVGGGQGSGIGVLAVLGVVEGVRQPGQISASYLVIRQSRNSVDWGSACRPQQPHCGGSAMALSCRVGAGRCSAAAAGREGGHGGGGWIASTGN